MSKTDSLHYKLCCEGAKWLKNLPWKGMLYEAVELVTQSHELTDVWATNGCSSWVIEVKTSLNDFHNDKNKIARKDCYSRLACGNFRYYLAPHGMIPLDEIPDEWGLLEWDGEGIVVAKEAKEIDAGNYGDLVIMCSLMRRNGIGKRMFNYRNR